MGKLVYDGKSVYEIDEDCLRKKEERERKKEMEWQRKESEKNKNGAVKKLPWQKNRPDREVWAIFWYN